MMLIIQLGRPTCLNFIEKNRIIIIRNHIEVLMLTHRHIHTQSHTTLKHTISLRIPFALSFYCYFDGVYVYYQEPFHLCN